MYITTTIPYVNARPHIGFALELVQADVLARFGRQRGEAVRFQAGTDDNSLKNVLAARAAAADVREFVDRNAEAFLALGPALSLSIDDFIRTSRDPRHRPGVERVWRACEAAGDLYRRRYQGRYCTGCEANRLINRVRPWELAKAERGGDVAAGRQLDAILYQLTLACSALGRELSPFLPDAAARITAQCTPADGRLPTPVPVFRRLG